MLHKMRNMPRRMPEMMTEDVGPTFSSGHRRTRCHGRDHSKSIILFLSCVNLSPRAPERRVLLKNRNKTVNITYHRNLHPHIPSYAHLHICSYCTPAYLYICTSPHILTRASSDLHISLTHFLVSLSFSLG